MRTPRRSGDSACQTDRTRASLLFAFLAVVGLAPPGEAQRVVAPQVLPGVPASRLQEAAIAVQAGRSDLFLDLRTVTEVMAALARARETAPDVLDRVPEGQFWAVELFVSDSLAAVMKKEGTFQTKGYFRPSWRLRRTGNRTLDSVLGPLDVDTLIFRVGAGPGDRRTPVLRITFRYAMNVPALLDRLASVPGVHHAISPVDDGVESGLRLTATPIPGGWRFDVQRVVSDCALGQCPAPRRSRISVWADSVRRDSLPEPPPA